MSERETDFLFKPEIAKQIIEGLQSSLDAARREIEELKEFIAERSGDASLVGENKGLRAELADARHTQTLAEQARDNWRKASDEKLREIEKLKAERDGERERRRVLAEARDDYDRIYRKRIAELEAALRGMLTHVGICDRRHLRSDGFTDCTYIYRARNILNQEGASG